MNQWTESQQAVIDSSARRLVCSAAAGSGKTAVMVERIVRLIREGETLKPEGMENIALDEELIGEIELMAADMAADPGRGGSFFFSGDHLYKRRGGGDEGKNPE